MNEVINMSIAVEASTVSLQHRPTGHHCVVAIGVESVLRRETVIRIQ